MPRVQIPYTDIGLRGNVIQRLMRPICSIRTGPVWERKGSIFSPIIATHDGSPSSPDPTEWSFATFLPTYRARYFEVWNRSNESADLLYLSKAYLTVFKTRRSMEIGEFLCLHSDPDEPESASHAKYKQGPHLHIIEASDPIPHAHIALNAGHLDQVLSSVNALSEAIELAVLMIEHEILREIEKQMLHKIESDDLEIE